MRIAQRPQPNPQHTLRTHTFLRACTHDDCHLSHPQFHLLVQIDEVFSGTGTQLPLQIPPLLLCRRRCCIAASLCYG